MSALNVSRSRKGQQVTATVQRITPATAEKLLGKNVKNRNIRKSNVDIYARDMERGHWMVSGEPISFDLNGNLVDGQHRLLAIIQSGCTIESLVVQGLDPSAQRVVDSGTKRSNADQFSLAGERNSSILASTARLVWLWDHGKIGLSPKTTYSDLVEVVEAEPQIKWSVDAASKARNLVPAHPSVFAFCLHICSRIDREEANYFFVDGVANKTAPSLAAGALVNRLTRAMSMGQRLTTVEQIGYHFRAWNLWRSGDEAGKLQAPRGRRGASGELLVPGGWTANNLPTPR